MVMVVDLWPCNAVMLDAGVKDVHTTENEILALVKCRITNSCRINISIIATQSLYNTSKSHKLKHKLSKPLLEIVFPQELGLWLECMPASNTCLIPRSVWWHQTTICLPTPNANLPNPP
eukprot:scaffold276654_cov18-Prasinocladus_malaysianus.AAC.1